MSRTTRSFKALGALAIGVAILSFSSVTQAASISYGSFGPVAPGVTFIDVTESSGTDPVPLYGPPTPFSVGLDFNPTAFSAFAADGGADITDGQLNFTIQSNGLGITSIGLLERGDYTLVGAPVTQVFAGAIILATVTEIGGVPVAPIPLAPVNASFGDQVPPNDVVTPWALGLNLNVPIANVTRIDVAVNNTLVATAAPGSAAFIAKKEFLIDVDIVPEPTSVALAGVALCGLGLVRRRG